MSSAPGIGTGKGHGHGHGKIILLGEHSVVYGRPAIAAGIARGCRAEAEPHTVDALSVEPWGVEIEATRPEATHDREQLRLAFVALCERYVTSRPAFRIRARMEVPGGAGLGGSAALSVAILRAMDAQLQRNSSYDDLLEASLAWERVFHGNPSGVDSAMAIRGGLAWYRRGEPLAPIRNARALQLVVANSGARGDTVAMVSSVARQHQRDPAKAEQSFDAIASLVTNGKRALETGDQRDLGQLMDLNQQLLNTFMLSTTKLEELCRAARAAGALGAKLTGSGGGGCIIALAADGGAAASIVQALRAHAADVFVMEVTP